MQERNAKVFVASDVVSILISLRLTVVQLCGWDVLEAYKLGYYYSPEGMKWVERMLMLKLCMSVGLKSTFVANLHLSISLTKT